MDFKDTELNQKPCINNWLTEAGTVVQGSSVCLTQSSGFLFHHSRDEMEEKTEGKLVSKAHPSLEMAVSMI